MNHKSNLQLQIHILDVLKVNIWGLVYIFKKLMGNEICCKVQKPQIGVIQQMDRNYVKMMPDKYFEGNSNKEGENIHIPSLKDKVNFTLNKHDFLSKQIHLSDNHLKKYREDVYDGQLDLNNRPNGYGKMYISDGSVYLGQFSHGKAHGKGAYIFNDGSFYRGDFVGNTAYSGEGHYQSDNLTYDGGFKNSTFNGSGQQKGSTHQFIGTYKQGHKVKGLLAWKINSEEYSYKGTFNQKNQFHGQGVLKEPKGIYEGSFVNGIKEGEGYFQGTNGINYKGQYKNGQKNGKGTITCQNDCIVYQGEILNGLPHGKGWAFSEEGERSQQLWIEGINSKLIQK